MNVGATGPIGERVFLFAGKYDMKGKIPMGIASYGIRRVSNLGHLQKIFDSGVVHLSEGRYSYALECFSKIVPQRPTLQDAWLGKGFSELHLGKYADAQMSFAKALDINRNSPEAMIGKAFAYIGQRNYEKAIDLIYFAIERRPKLALEKAVHYDLGVCWQARVHVYDDQPNASDEKLDAEAELAVRCADKAIEHLGRAVELDLSDAECAERLSSVYCWKAHAELSKHKHDEAIALVDKAIAASPGNMIFTVEKVFLLVCEDRQIEAVDCFQGALAAKPELADQISGSVAKRIGSLAEDFYHARSKAAGIFIPSAIAFFERALNRLPVSCIPPIQGCLKWLSFLNGDILVKSGKYPEALASYERYLLYEPQNVDALLGKATVLGMIGGRYEEAVEYCDAALKVDPGKALAWFEKGALLAEMQKYQQAIDCVERSLKLYPTMLHVWFVKGEIYYMMGRKKDSLDSLNKYLSYDPDNLYVRGKIAFLSGQIELAAQYLGKHLKANPGDNNANELLLEIEEEYNNGPSAAA